VFALRIKIMYSIGTRNISYMLEHKARQIRKKN
jgi:hypothetical protein